MATKIDPSDALERTWLTETEAAYRLGMSTKWMQKMRHSGFGPRYAKFGSAVRYSLSDLEKYERERLRSSTSDLGLTTKGPAS